MHTDGLPPRHLLYALVGAALQLVMGVFVLASGLVAPPWAVALLIAVWLFGVVASVRSWREKMYTPLVWGVVVGLVWVGVVSVGGAVLGWNP